VSTYRITQVAERSGFSAATLRFYEQIGLVPPAARTAAGYRQYDHDVLERLAFIARAKRLGCSLDEIAELLVAWDGGRCGPVQDCLRALVATKLSTAAEQRAELERLAGELRVAAANLERHQPDGPCDDRCGCTAASAAVPVAVGLSDQPGEERTDVPIACTLPADSTAERLDEWNVLLARVRERSNLDDGVRLTFEDSLDLAELARLVAAEHVCCSFFAFSITVDGRGVGLEVRAAPDAQSAVAAIFGAAA